MRIGQTDAVSGGTKRGRAETLQGAVAFTEGGAEHIHESTMKAETLATILTALILFLAALTVRAEAVTEFCPATVENASPIGASLGTAASAYAYELQALTPRAVDASIIADTDHGWFSWSIADVTLHGVTRTNHIKLNGRYQLEEYVIAESAPLAVAFPSAVVLRHAWVVLGKTSGEVKLGWDARGPTSCDPPGFASASIADPPKAPTAQATPTPLPSAAGATSTAVPTNPPFGISTCAKPFAEATVTRPVAPDFSDFGLLQPGGAALSVVAVAIDEHGKRVDAWLLSSSGLGEFDLAALRAARVSEYSGGISYCRPTKDTYLFQAVAFPNY